MLDVLKDAGLDTLRLLPFLYIVYLIMELLERHAGPAFEQKVTKVGRWGPLWGALLGVVPQCGFSAVSASLYAGGMITAGTLLAVFMSTSDEMLPILLSESIPVRTVVSILAVKVVIACLSGFLITYLYHLVFKEQEHTHIAGVCESEHCHCDDHNAAYSALYHTVKIAVFIFLFSFCIDGLVAVIGEDKLRSLITGSTVAGPLVCALIGLVPSCAPSVVITQLYVDGIITSGIMMAGLLANAGTGLLVLLRLDRKNSRNLFIVVSLYLLSVLWGVLIDVCGLVF